MKKHLCFLLILFPLLTLALNKQGEVERNGMIFKWQIVEGHLKCEVIAPCQGWIGVGFNSKDQLKGTNLIMGAAEHGFFKMDDRYIVKAGVHKSVIELNGQEAVLNRSVVEVNGTTKMRFTIPLKAVDQFHFDLISGNRYYILMAYSVSDDFGHHSRMRTSVLITL